ncbi:hypothetical protein R3P38DRAFT_2691294 [Favolaschia claudopus]|uniref:DUF6535 domain-containing protein n=1 Tax=Favolaschia claudopus TaxID=2862362 RepID=A0AAW0CXA9_9AGAR
MMMLPAPAVEAFRTLRGEPLRQHVFLSLTPMGDNDSDDSWRGYSTEGDTAGVKIWKVYAEEAEKYDTALVESWKSDMEGVLIFAGLFSAILTAFLIESYKALTPDSGDEMKAVLIQISAQLSGIANRTSVDLPTPEPFVTPTSSLVCNLLWFVSLGLSLSCALLATLVEQWAPNFNYKTELRSTPATRACNFAYFYYGLKRFKMHVVVEIIPLLLHASLLLFFAGLVAFLVPVNTVVMISVTILLGLGVIAYTTLTVFPLFSQQSPYQTPLSAVLFDAIQLIYTMWGFPSHAGESMIAVMSRAAQNIPNRLNLDFSALFWTLGSLADDFELEPFLEGIVETVATSERGSYYDDLIGRLIGEGLLLVRAELLVERYDSAFLLTETQARRQLIALKCLWAMATIPAREPTDWSPPPIALRSLHRKLIRQGHDYFLDFMIYAASFGSPPQFPNRHLKRLLTDQRSHQSHQGAVTPEIAAKYSDVVNTVIDRQCRELTSHQLYVESILAILMQPLAHFGPNSNVCLPSDLSLYVSKPFVMVPGSESPIIQYCDRWWLGSCLTMELKTKLSHADVNSDSVSGSCKQCGK